MRVLGQMFALRPCHPHGPAIPRCPSSVLSAVHAVSPMGGLFPPVHAVSPMGGLFPRRPIYNPSCERPARPAGAHWSSRHKQAASLASAQKCACTLGSPAGSNQLCLHACITQPYSAVLCAPCRLEVNKAKRSLEPASGAYRVFQILSKCHSPECPQVPVVCSCNPRNNQSTTTTTQNIICLLQPPSAL